MCSTQVDDVNKLAKVLQGRAAAVPPTGLPPSSTPARVPTTSDVNCVLVQCHDGEDTSPEEAAVAEHCESLVGNDNFSPTIALPD